MRVYVCECGPPKSGVRGEQGLYLTNFLQETIKPKGICGEHNEEQERERWREIDDTVREEE